MSGPPPGHPEPRPRRVRRPVRRRLAFLDPDDAAALSALLSAGVVGAAVALGALAVGLLVGLLSAGFCLASPFC